MWSRSCGVSTQWNMTPMKQDELMPVSVAPMALEMCSLSGGGHTEEGKRLRVSALRGQ